MSDPINTNKAGSSGNDSSETQTKTPLPVPIEVENAWRECEARLQILRSDIEKLRTNANLGGKPATFPDDAKIQQVLDILTGLSKDPFFLIERDLAHAEKESRANQKTNALPPANETPSQKTNATTAPKTPNQNSPAANSTNSASAGANPNITPDDAMQRALTQAQSFVQPAVPSAASLLMANGSSPNFNITPFANASSDASQEAQASSDLLLAALEQNTQMSASLFNNMLALIDGQNRMLGEFDRKISDLSGQLNSLKNP